MGFTKEKEGNKNAPILDFFDEEEFINKESYIKHNLDDFSNVHLLEKYGVDTALFIFSKSGLDGFVDTTKVEEFYDFISGSGRYKCYIYDKKFVLAITPLGGPSAGALMEELGFMGIKNFFACGSAGQVNHNLDSKKFILVDKAIRNEGTSYHYIAPSLYAQTDKELTEFMAKYLEVKGFDYKISTTWTTDAFYRETPSEMALRQSQGADCVEMECASWCAIAKFRNYKFAQLLYFSDALKQSGWAHNQSKTELKVLIIQLMINCVEEFVKSKHK